MQKLFNRILVPVSFRENDLHLLDTAMLFAQKCQCRIYMLHVIPLRTVPARDPASLMTDDQVQCVPEQALAIRKMKELVFYIWSGSDQKIAAEYGVFGGTWDEVVIDLAQQERFDLLLVHQRSWQFLKSNDRLNTGRVVQITNIPVISIPESNKVSFPHAVVVPIVDFLPVKRLIYAVYIASIFDAAIRLLGVVLKEDAGEVNYYIERAYRLIKENTPICVTMERKYGETLTETLSEFSIVAQHDLILINPGDKIKAAGFFDFLFRVKNMEAPAAAMLIVNPA